MVKATGKDILQVADYLIKHRRIDRRMLDAFDRTGTLSHLLLQELAKFEEDASKMGQILPSQQIQRSPQSQRTDPENIVAFSQLQYRTEKEKKARMSQQQTRGAQRSEPKSAIGSNEIRKRKSTCKVAEQEFKQPKQTTYGETPKRLLGEPKKIRETNRAIDSHLTPIGFASNENKVQTEDQTSQNYWTRAISRDPMPNLNRNPTDALRDGSITPGYYQTPTREERSVQRRPSRNPISYGTQPLQTLNVHQISSASAMGENTPGVPIDQGIRDGET